MMQIVGNGNAKAGLGITQMLEFGDKAIENGRLETIRDEMESDDTRYV
jgi:hypothetical protein